MLPNVDNENLAGGQGEQRTLPFKILVLSPFSTIGSLHVHDEDVVGHRPPLILGHPYSLCCLASLGLGHDIELGAEEVVQQRRLSGRLGTEDGYEVIVKAGVNDVGRLKVTIYVGTTRWRALIRS